MLFVGVLLVIGAGLFVRTAAPPSFQLTEAVMCRELGPDREPVRTSPNFLSGTEKISTCFTWKNAPARMEILARWFYTSEDLFILDLPIVLTRKSNTGLTSLKMASGKTFPPGSYRVDFEARGKVLKSVPFEVE